jgi:hypothetical protein
MCINNGLSVEGLLLEKQRLEDALEQAIAALVHNFKDRTGLDIRSVDVQMVETSGVGHKRRHYRVGAVDVVTNLV